MANLPRRPAASKPLHDWLVEMGSFPKGERADPYQEYFHNGAWRPGQREVVNRAATMGFFPKRGETVLELGSQMGGFLQLAVLEGARFAAGVELDADHAEASRHLLSGIAADGWCVTEGDITDEALLRDVKANLDEAAGGRRLDHLLILSMAKHIGGGDYIERMIELFDARNTYVETNAVSRKGPCPYEKTIVEKLGGVLVGVTEDRNTRRVYRISR